jgi:hypothetical protein
MKSLEEELKRKILRELRKPGEVDQFRKDAADLKSVDTRDNSWRINLDEYMSKYGFRALGSGKYASVYGNERYPYVIKVFQKDSAYLRWIKFSLANKNNPYVPKIKGKVVKITPLVYAIRLEKLSPTFMSGEFADEYQQWMRDNSHQAQDPNIQEILNFFANNKKLLDLHSENVMKRGNQLVIIDPFYNWFGKYEPGKYTIDPDNVDPSVF